MVKINRRQFIALSAAGVGTALVGNWLRQETISSQPLASSSASVIPIYQSSDGLLELDFPCASSGSQTRRSGSHSLY